MPAMRSRLAARWVILGLLASAFAGGVAAQTMGGLAGAPVDFSGAWRLDDAGSDGPEALQAMLRGEAQRETAPMATPANPTASPPSGMHGGAGGHGGHRGGGGGMGHGGMGGGGGGGGHGGNRPDKSAANADGKPAAQPSYALPPLLKTDSVLLVQQDARALQIRLDDGSRLDAETDDRERQSLSGSALVRCRRDGTALLVTIRYADGSQLDQRWERAPDGRHLIVTGDWKVPELKQSVRFRRSYLAVG